MNADNSTENHDESTSHPPIDTETIESWTFLGDESIQGSNVMDNIVEHHDEQIKTSTKTSRSSSGCLS